MSKYCGNCGAKMDDDARVCGYCGTRFEDMEIQHIETPKIKIPKQSKMTPEKKKKIKKSIIAVEIAIVLVVVAIVAINIVSDNTGYKGTLKKAINAFADYDMETLMSVTSEIEYMNIDMEDSISKEVSRKLDDYESAVGRDLEISYKIIDSYKLSDRKFSEFTQYVENNYKYDCSDISQIMKVDLQLEIKGTQKTKTENVSLYLINERNKWYVFDGYIGKAY